MFIAYAITISWVDVNRVQGNHLDASFLELPILAAGEVPPSGGFYLYCSRAWCHWRATLLDLEQLAPSCGLRRRGRGYPKFRWPARA